MIRIQIPKPSDPGTVMVDIDGRAVGGIKMVLIDGRGIQLLFSSLPEADAIYDQYSGLLREEGALVLRN